MSTTTTLIESRTNRLGIEVQHRGEMLRVHRMGELIAVRRLANDERPTWASTTEYLDERVPFVLRNDVDSALEEALRVLRDGRGLCEVA